MLLTRPGGSSTALIGRLEALGAQVAARPTIALVPPSDPRPARHAVKRLRDYEWLVFSSPSAVRFFRECAKAARVEPASIEVQVAAIGPATARALAGCGLAVNVTAEDSRSEGLAAALRGRVRNGQHVLLVRPEGAEEDLE